MVVQKTKSEKKKKGSATTARRVVAAKVSVFVLCCCFVYVLACVGWLQRWVFCVCVCVCFVAALFVCKCLYFLRAFGSVRGRCIVASLLSFFMKVARAQMQQYLHVALAVLSVCLCEKADSKVLLRAAGQ